jgi:hypothetical protein
MIECGSLDCEFLAGGSDNAIGGLGVFDRPTKTFCAASAMNEDRAIEFGRRTGGGFSAG